MTARLVAGPDLGERHTAEVQNNHMHNPKYDATSLTAVLRFTKEES